MFDAGMLVNLRSVSSTGRFHEVASTTPAESSVAWTSFTRAANPGVTGIFDFVERPLGSYQPTMSAVTYKTAAVSPNTPTRYASTATSALLGAGLAYTATSRYSRRTWLKCTAALAAGTALSAGIGSYFLSWRPDHQMVASSTVQGKAWWDHHATAGRKSTAMRIPMTFPARAQEGVKLLAGLGVPDISGANGTFLLLSDDKQLLDKHGQSDGCLQISWHDRRATVDIPGPMSVDDDHRQLKSELIVSRGTNDELVVRTNVDEWKLRAGAWSPWIRLAFRYAPFHVITAVTRLYVLSADGPTTIYMAPLQYDPTEPPKENAVSSPPRFAAELAADVGTYSTIGWETQTRGVLDGVLDRQAYLEDVLRVINDNENLFTSQVSRRDWDNLMLVVQATDQASHIFFDDQIDAFIERGEVPTTDHPLLLVYKRMDEFVGRAQATAQELNAKLVVMSDHGFSRYRRSLHLNTWLARNGWLALKDRQQWDDDQADNILAGPVWANVDWRNTRAYALGLGGIYLNVVGREPEGIVKRDGEYEFLQDRLIGQLGDWADSDTGQPIFHKIYRQQDIYAGPCVARAPDLVIGLNPGYRVSSATVVGGIPEQEIADNDSPWCADHCGIDASFIPGICITNFQTDWSPRILISDIPSHLWPDLLSGENES